MTSDTNDFINNAAVAPSNADKKRYPLEYPITNTKGEIVTELWIRRPLLRDKQVAEWQAPENDPFEITLRLLSAVTEQPLELMEELDAELDMVALLNLLSKSYKDQPQIEGNTLILKYPIAVQGKNIERLTLQRPKAKDSLQYKDEKAGEAMARLCGYRIEDLLDMDLMTDWLALEKIFNTFRKKQPQRK